MRRFLQHRLFSGWLLVLASWGGYFTFLWPRMVFWTKEGIVAGWLGVWADWSVHATYASVFAYRPWFAWLSAHPLYVDKKFTYPFLADAISGWMQALGLDWVAAFVIPSVLTSLGMILVIYTLLWLAHDSLQKAYVGVTLFLTSGGLGFLWWFRDLYRERNWQTVFFPPQEYTHIGEIKLEWINVISGQLVPQRALLLGLLWTGTILGALVWRERKQLSRWWFDALLALMSAALLIIHVHSFIVLAVTCLVWLIIKIGDWKQWLRYGILTALVSLPLFWWMYGGEVGGTFFRWLPGWLAHPDSKDVNWLWFWLLNWGLFLPVAAWGTYRYQRYTHPWVVAGWVLFVLTNLILFQPYDWDNSKILTWVYLFLTIPVVDVLFGWWRAGRWQKGVTVMLFVILSLSGWLDVWRITQTEQLSHLMWSRQDVQRAAQFRRISQPTDTVLVSDKHNHWVSTHTGRQVLLGYRGWMWTYGIEYGPREMDLYAMFTGGDEALELLDAYSVDYVVIGPSERFDFKANEAFFAQRFPVVMQDAHYTVYMVKPDQE